MYGQYTEDLAGFARRFAHTHGPSPSLLYPKDGSVCLIYFNLDFIKS